MDSIAELLKETRKAAGIDFDEVSKDLNIDKLLLQNIEEGKIGSFKDIFELKEYLSNYAKYLGLNHEKLISDFNEYLFEYTSKIPVAEIEKEIKEIAKDNNQEIVSPYTVTKEKEKKKIYIFIYILILILVILTIFWSINQITLNKKNAYVVSYRK